MDGRRMVVTGSVVGAVAGTVFVVVNAGDLPGAGFLRVLAVFIGVALLVLAALVLRGLGAGPAPRPGASRGPSGSPFDRRYGAIVLAELIALFAGVRVLGGVFDRPWLGVGWVAVVVGVHFLGLGALWHAWPLIALGAALTVLGVLGLLLGAVLDSPGATAAVAGVGSGVALFVSAGVALRGVRTG